MKGKGSRVPAPRSRERTVIAGYLLAVATAELAYAAMTMFATGDYLSRFDTGYFALLSCLVIVPLWILVAVPFGVVRALAGASGFAGPLRATCLGSGLGLTTLPAGVGIGCVVEIDNPHPFLPELTQAIHGQWHLYAIAGAVAGLTYWAVEFSPAPSAIHSFVTDTAPLRGTRGRVSRRLAAWLAAAVVSCAALPLARWWWRPHVHEAASGPTAAFVREWPTGGQASFVAWVSGRSRLVSLSNATTVTVWAADGHVEWEKRFPGVEIFDAVANDVELVVAGSMTDHAAFLAIDLAMGEITHREPDPAPGAAGQAGITVNLAMSPDGTSFAVSYSAPRSSQPVSVYDTRTWQRKSKVDFAGDARLGSHTPAFSANGRYLAFGSARTLVVADATTEAVVRTLPVSPYGIAFSPKGDLVAVVASIPGGIADRRIEVYDLADGRIVASHAMSAALDRSSLAWDPQGRFVAFIDAGDRVRLWDPQSAGDNGATIDARSRPRSFAISHDGSCLAVANGDHVSLFRLVAATGAC